MFRLNRGEFLIKGGGAAGGAHHDGSEEGEVAFFHVDKLSKGDF
jgi:hypothetical protein